MRHILFSFCLLSHLWSFSQANPADKLIPISEFGDWVTKKISLDEVTKTLGMPTRETVTPNERACEYKFNGDVLTLQFDQDKKLTHIAFINQVPVSVNNLSYEKIKATKKASTKQQIMVAFGRPSQLAATASEEVWFYNITDKDGYKALAIYFDLADADHIKYYSYSEEVKRETALTSSIPTSFHVGASTISEVQALLGKPSKLTLESEGEEQWYYHSKNSTLAVMFDKQSKLRDFSFHRDEN